MKLKVLDCCSTKVSKLPRLSVLEELHCSKTRIKSIPNSLKKLKYLECVNIYLKIGSVSSHIIKLHTFNSHIKGNWNALKHLSAFSSTGCEINASRFPVIEELCFYGCPEVVLSNDLTKLRKFYTIGMLNATIPLNIMEQLQTANLINYNEVTSDDDVCAVCLEVLGDGLGHSCGNKFHKTCIVRWYQQNPTCPLCRGN